MKGKTNKPGGRRSAYSTSFMRQVVNTMLSENLSYSETAKRFAIPNKGTVYYWHMQFSSELEPEINIPPMTAEEQQELQVLKDREKQLEKALELAKLKILGLETMIDIAEQELKIEIRKKSGAKPSKS